MTENEKKYMTEFPEYGIVGNAAVQPARKEPEQEPQKRRKAAAAPAPQPKTLSPLYILVMVAALVMLVYGCITLLQLQSSIQHRQKNITSLETELTNLKLNNQVLAGRIDAEIDLDEVYEVATTRLGMVYPDNNERISYSSEEREYVRQYEDIPDE